MKKKIKKIQQGAGLFELVITIALMAILISIVIPSWNRSEDIQTLKKNGRKTIFDIRTSQNNALIGRREEDINFPRGFGIYADKVHDNRYRLFGLSEKNLFDPDNLAGSFIFSEYELSDIDSMEISLDNKQTWNTESFQIIFLPPEAEIWYAKEDDLVPSKLSGNTPIFIRLGKNIGFQMDYETIIINSFGLITRE